MTREELMAHIEVAKEHDDKIKALEKKRAAVRNKYNALVDEFDVITKEIDEAKEEALLNGFNGVEVLYAGLGKMTFEENNNEN